MARPPPPCTRSSLHTLLGPPECHRPPPPQGLKVANFNDDGQLPQKGYTENNSATFQSTGNPCLDFFFHVVPDTPPKSLTRRLESAWAHDPLTTLKFVCNLRGVRGTRKSNKEGFHAAARWLFKNHPRTLACNVGAFVGFGYLKDLPEILYRLLEGLDVRARQKGEWQKRKGTKSRRRRLQSFPVSSRPNKSRRKKGRNSSSSLSEDGRVVVAAARDRELKRRDRKLKWKGTIAGRGLLSISVFSCRNISRRKKGRNSSGAATSSLPKEVRVEIAAARDPELKRRDQEQKRKASELRNKKRIAMAVKLLERYKRDGDFRFLHDAVSGHFVNCLTADLEFLKSGDINKISLAAKWCPSFDSSFDLATLLCESIAKLVFPRDRFPEYEGLEEVHYAYRVRDRLRKNALVPLRRILELPEVYIVGI